ncbi:MAG: hypothetical protein R2827_05645 [Bdellovibrionales bacterium]
MANILIIEQDEKVAELMNNYVKEMDSHSCDYFLSYKDFEDAYYDKENDHDNRLATIDIVIVRLDCMTELIQDFIGRMNVKLKEHGFAPKHPTKFIITKFEDDGVKKSSLIHPQVLDIIYLPIDRLLFLQKIQIIAELPKKADPKYLFSEPVKFEVEVSKKSSVSRVTRSGFTIYSSIRIAPCSLANVYLCFDKNNPLKIPCRVSSYEPISEDPNDGYLIRFNFYCLSRENSTFINNFINDQSPHFQDFINSRKEVFKPGKNISGVELQPKQVLVLDHEPSCFSIQQELNETFYDIEASYESDYKTLHDRYFSESASKNASMADLDDVTSGSIVFSVDPETKSLVTLFTQFSENDKFLGFKASRFFDMPGDWKKIFNTEIARVILEQGLKEAKTDEPLKKLSDIETSDDEEKLMVFEFTKLSDNEVKIEIKPPLQQKSGKQPKAANAERNPKLSKIDLVIVHRDFISENVNNWVKQFVAKCKDKKLIRRDSIVQFIIVDPDETLMKNPPWNRHIVSIIHNASARKALFSLVSQALQSKYSIYSIFNLNFVETNIDAHIGRPVRLNAVAEYGASITDKIPIKPGVILYLHGSIYEQAPGKMLAAKFYHVIDAPDDKGNPQYTSSFIYFGINEVFLKYARNWIRENYAQRKEREAQELLELQSEQERKEKALNRKAK